MRTSNTKKQRLIALFFLGCLFFNYPLLSLFNAPHAILGIPLLYVYVFFVWICLIGLTIIIVERSG